MQLCKGKSSVGQLKVKSCLIYCLYEKVKLTIADGVVLSCATKPVNTVASVIFPSMFMARSVRP